MARANTPLRHALKQLWHGRHKLPPPPRLLTVILSGLCVWSVIGLHKSWSLITLALLLIWALLVSGCATTSLPPVVVRPPELPPPPAAIMQKYEPNFLKEMETILYRSPPGPTR